MSTVEQKAGKIVITTVEQVQEISTLIIGAPELRIPAMSRNLHISQHAAAQIHDELISIDDEWDHKLGGYDLVNIALKIAEKENKKTLAVIIEKLLLLRIYRFYNQEIQSQKDYALSVNKIDKLCWLNNSWLLAINNTSALYLLKINPKETAPFFHQMKNLIFNDTTDCVKLQLPEIIGIPIRLFAHRYKAHTCVVGNYNSKHHNSTFFELNLVNKKYRKIGTYAFDYIPFTIDLSLDFMLPKLRKLDASKRSTFIEDCLQEFEGSRQ